MHLEVPAGKDFVSSVSSSRSRDPQLAGVFCRPRPLTRRTGYFPLFDRDLWSNETRNDAPGRARKAGSKGPYLTHRRVNSFSIRLISISWSSLSRKRRAHIENRWKSEPNTFGLSFPRPVQRPSVPFDCWWSADILQRSLCGAFRTGGPRYSHRDLG